MQTREDTETRQLKEGIVDSEAQRKEEHQVGCSHDHDTDHHSHHHDHTHQGQQESIGMDEEEQVVFLRIVRAFKEYKAHANSFVDRSEHDFVNLPQFYQKLAPRMPQKFKLQRSCIEINSRLLEEIIQPHSMFENQTAVVFS
jgi:ABC-type Zn2+ transport system substrate-binding protein/surface adhesin